MSAPFETRLPAGLTRRFGVEELHGLTFQPVDARGGARDAISISIPETSRRDQKRALAIARALRARVSVICDKADQAAEFRRFAGPRLPDHRFVALERANSGGWALQ